MTAPRGRLLKATQAAERLGMGYYALLRKIATHDIAVVRTDDGRLLGIYERDCDDWVDRHRTPATAREHEPSALTRRDVDRQVDELVGTQDRIF